MEVTNSMEISTPRYSRKNVFPAFIITMAAAFLVYYLVGILQQSAEGNNYIYDFGTLMGGAAGGSALWRGAWFMADVTEGAFVGSLPASVMIIIGSYIGAYLERKKSPAMGTGVDGNGQIFTVLTISGFVSLIIGPLVYSTFFSSGLFVPSFAAFLSVQAMIINFSAATPARAATVTVLGILM